ncbi:MAG: cobaltochelatase subunit CobN, partial [Methyloligellaceae bacterium]
GAVKLLSAGLYWPELDLPKVPDLKPFWTANAPVAAIIFYRALIIGDNFSPIKALITELCRQGMNPLPIFVGSLKDPLSAQIVEGLFQESRPDVILNTTGFAVSAYGDPQGFNPLLGPDCPVLQVILSGSDEQTWEEQTQGLTARDLAMNVVLPEIDGRLITRALSFKKFSNRLEHVQTRIVSYQEKDDRIQFTCALASAWARLGKITNHEKKIAIILANYPNRDGRLANGVGFDTPESTQVLLAALNSAGYHVDPVPATGQEIMDILQTGPTNDLSNPPRRSEQWLTLESYQSFLETLNPEIVAEITERWGIPADDPYVSEGAFQLAVHQFGNVVMAIQPARGYNIDPKDSYHDPDLVPPHNYLAFYIWLRDIFNADCVIQNGKHGNQEWLPGKSVALSETCYPEIALGPVPLVYPFIVNDPGEGAQAKRRSTAVIIDHLTPPIARAESYGTHQELEGLIDEYYLAMGMDQRRAKLLRKRILTLSQSSEIAADCGLTQELSEAETLNILDTYLCELKEAQIRDGLHILGRPPVERQRHELLVSLTRLPRGIGQKQKPSLLRALAEDLKLGEFDPLDCEFGDPWEGPRPEALVKLSGDTWRSHGDTVERLELYALELVETRDHHPDLPLASTVLREITEDIDPRLVESGEQEINSALKALDGRFVPPGPSGAPTRGRIDVLPTGRNFYSVDNRTVPTPTAWELGRRSAELLVERHVQDHGNWLRTMGLSVWGTSNMRTGGDDIAQALALIGARPVWDTANGRVTGFEVITSAELGRPRVDVTLRISGFFRDAFPTQIDLFDSAVRTIADLEEEEDDQNPIKGNKNSEVERLIQSGLPQDEAARRASFRIFGSKPGAYGAGLQVLIDEKFWEAQSELAENYIEWGGYAYGSGVHGQSEEQQFRTRLETLEAVVQNQDNREHDLLDSDDYYQFEGGMTAAVTHIRGETPQVYHNDHSRPERPKINTLDYEIGKVVRSRVANPKWIEGVMRHGYKGAFEMVATVDYLFAFAATTNAVKNHHFQMAYDAYLGDEEVRAFILQSNPAGLNEMAARFKEAIDRDIWHPRSNSAYRDIHDLCHNSSA